MEVIKKCCRICVSESEFNVSLFGNYCKRTNMIDKILVCLKLVIEETDHLDTICFKCAENIERYYDFIMTTKKSQMKFGEQRQLEGSFNRRHVTTYVREQVYDADCTFSFLYPQDDNEELPKPSTPMFSYFTPPAKVMKKSEPVWKTPREVEKAEKRENAKFSGQRKQPRQKSRDLFESQSQEAEEQKPFDWNLTPVENMLKRVRDKCFGRSDF